MMKYTCTSRSRWTVYVVALALVGSHGAFAASKTRNLNPYHEQQLEAQIRKCASGVMACTDEEERSLKQQELCQLLIRAERYDEALQVAYNVYRAETSVSERKAAYHFMVAEIYNRKMKAATTTEDMLRCRQSALAAAQEVLDQKYPAKWGVSGYARDLIRDLNDSNSQARVRQRVQSRGQGDATKEAIADAQRRYLDATQGHGSRSGSGAGQSQYVRVPAQERSAVSDMQVSSVNMDATVDMQESGAAVRSPMEQARRNADEQALAIARQGREALGGGGQRALPAQPNVTRVVSPMQRLTEGEQQAMSRLGAAGLLTSQPGVGEAAQTRVETRRPPIMVNGQPANSSMTANFSGGAQGASVDEVVQNNLATLLEAARKRRAAERSGSPYATGQLPQTNAR